MTIAKELENIILHANMEPKTKSRVLELIIMEKSSERAYKNEIRNLKRLLAEKEEILK